MSKKKRYLRAIDVLNLSYIALIGFMTLLFGRHLEKWLSVFLLYAGFFIGLIIFYRTTAFSKRLIVRAARDMITPFLIIFYYETTEPLNHMFFHDFLDAFFVKWEQAVFGMQPAIEFVKAIPNPLFSDYMHFSYFSYYFFIPWLGLPLWFHKKYKAYDLFMFASLLNMAFCFLFHIIFPSAGPWHYFTEADGILRGNFPGYVFVPVMEIVLKYGEIASGAFPSSHVAMATVILLYAWRYSRKIFWPMLPVFLSLCASTVYTQAHYFIDIPTGFFAGAFFFVVGDAVKKWIERKFALRVSDDFLFEEKSGKNSGVAG